MNTETLKRLVLCCGAVTALWLPAQVQAQFNFVTNNGAIIITGYNGSDGNVIIPDTINGCPVTTIAIMAFYYQAALTNVTIPNSVTNIGNVAFAGCSGLLNVAIGNGVTSIGQGAFAGCSALTNIDVDAANSNYATVAGALFDKTMTTLIQCPGGKTGNYEIPNGVTIIADGSCAWCASLSNVSIPTSVASIGNSSFYYCSNLLSVAIGSGVNNIGSYAFNGCSGLSSLTTSTVSTACAHGRPDTFLVSVFRGEP